MDSTHGCPLRPIRDGFQERQYFQWRSASRRRDKQLQDDPLRKQLGDNLSTPQDMADEASAERTPGFKVGEKKTLDEYQKLGKFTSKMLLPSTKEHICTDEGELYYTKAWMVVKITLISTFLHRTPRVTRY